MQFRKVEHKQSIAVATVVTVDSWLILLYLWCVWLYDSACATLASVKKIRKEKAGVCSKSLIETEAQTKYNKNAY